MLSAKKAIAFTFTKQTSFFMSVFTISYFFSVIIGSEQQFYIAMLYLEMPKTLFFDGKNITDFLD